MPCINVITVLQDALLNVITVLQDALLNVITVLQDALLNVITVLQDALLNVITVSVYVTLNQCMMQLVLIQMLVFGWFPWGPGLDHHCCILGVANCLSSEQLYM